MSPLTIVINPPKIPVHRRIAQQVFQAGSVLQQWLWSWTTVIVAEVLVRLRRSEPAAHKP